MPASGDQASLGILALLDHPAIILPRSWAWPVIVFILGKTLYRHVNFEIVHVMQASRCGTCKIVAWNLVGGTVIRDGLCNMCLIPSFSLVTSLAERLKMGVVC